MVPEFGGEVDLKNLEFLNGILNTRSTTSLGNTRRVVVGIPGGPGIPGNYMDKITVALAKHLGAAPVVVDLPNHGSSGRRTTSGSIQYAEVRGMLAEFLTELSRPGSEIVLMGHSLGAVIALDLLRSGGPGIAKTVLIGMPIEFERNPEFTNFLTEIGAPSYTDEAGFAKWWKAVLPAYFNSQPSEQSVELLTQQTCWLANEQFTVGLPTASFSATSLTRKMKETIVYLEGEKEIVIPRNNYQRMADLLPEVPRAIVAQAGHFPMLENPQEVLAQVIRLLAMPEYP